MNHKVEKIEKGIYDKQNGYKWAVLWKDTIVCICPDEVWAKQIAWALDFAKPYDEQEND